MTDLISTRITADHLRGALEVEVTDRGVRPHRLPADLEHRQVDGRERRAGDAAAAASPAQPAG